MTKKHDKQTITCQLCTVKPRKIKFARRSRIYYIIIWTYYVIENDSIANDSKVSVENDSISIFKKSIKYCHSIIPLLCIMLF